MDLTWIDWAVVIGAFVFFVTLAIISRQYTKSTADFLTANRLAGRYLLTLSEGMAGLGAVTIVASWQTCYRVGFSSGWWGGLGTPIGLLMTVTGWVIYRYRETRVMTLAQLFEIRYSRNFRILAGFICWLSGILNFGVFPAAGANFFMNYCNLPKLQVYVINLGFASHEVSLMYILLVVSLVGIALFFTFMGGQIAVMITDFFQSFFCNVVLVSILILLLIKFPLGKVFDGLMISEAGYSMVDPFDAGKSEFDPFFFIIGIFGTIFNRLSWQGSQGYFCSAKNPHEAKMAGILSQFRGWGFMYSIILVPLVAYLIMHHPDYAADAAVINEKLSLISNPQIRDQMLVPMTMTNYMPIGLVGAFAAVMFAAFISTNDTYLHSWGSILVQDVILPVRNKRTDKAIGTKKHLLLLRVSIIFVAAFIILFSIFYPQTMPIVQYFALTASIWLGGAGAVIIGALYTRWGKTSGAYAALITGSLLSFSGIMADIICDKVYDVQFNLPSTIIYGLFVLMGFLAVVITWMILRHSGSRKRAFLISTWVALGLLGLLFATEMGWFNKGQISQWTWSNYLTSHVAVPVRMGGQRIYFFAMMLSVQMYALFSFIGKPGNFNLDKLLHRGKYAIESDHADKKAAASMKKTFDLKRAFGLTADFTFFDKILYWFTVFKSIILFVVFLIVTVIATCSDVFTPRVWMAYHKWWFWFWVLTSFVIAVWLGLGGLRDCYRLFKDLQKSKHDFTDDGSVQDHSYQETDIDEIT